MTVDQLIEYLARLRDDGYGNVPVYARSNDVPAVIPDNDGTGFILLDGVLAADTAEPCPRCGGRLALDDTSGVVYCEANSDHYRSDMLWPK